MGRKRKNTGLGDTIANVTKAIGIEPCEGCNKRKNLLNVLFPFNTPSPMTEEEKEQFKSILERENQKLLTAEQIDIIFKIFERTFKVKIENCPACGSSVINATIKKLTKLYSYES
jgi:hypothetical protein